jgi:hypothetical protein
MLLTVAAFTFGLTAGYVILRLGQNKPLDRWGRHVLRPLGSVLMVTSFTSAAALLFWAASIGSNS